MSDATDQRMDEFMATMEPEVADAFVSTYDRVRARERARGRAEGQAEGRAEGQAAGRAEGQAELLASLLTLRFGDLGEETRAAVFSASTDQIAAWSARLIEGSLRLEEVTG